MIQEKIINLLGIRPNGVTLCHIDIPRNKPIPVVMEAITETDEADIDRAGRIHGNISYTRKRDQAVISAKDIYLYGEVDINSDKDLDYIEKFNLIDEDGGEIYSNFDYNKGHFTTINRHAKRYTTWNCIEWFLFNHVLIGKPERIIIYKNPTIKK